jgi:hypothetical protein
MRNCDLNLTSVHFGLIKTNLVGLLGRLCYYMPIGGPRVRARPSLLNANASTQFQRAMNSSSLASSSQSQQIPAGTTTTSSGYRRTTLSARRRPGARAPTKARSQYRIVGRQPQRTRMCRRRAKSRRRSPRPPMDSTAWCLPPSVSLRSVVHYWWSRHHRSRRQQSPAPAPRARDSTAEERTKGDR